MGINRTTNKKRKVYQLYHLDVLDSLLFYDRFARIFYIHLIELRITYHVKTALNRWQNQTLGNSTYNAMQLPQYKLFNLRLDNYKLIDGK